MRIIRDGAEYELTRAEMREVYEAMKVEYLREDIECKADEMEINLSKETMDYVTSRVSKVLSNNDSYWDSYWMTIEYMLNEQAEN